MSGHTPGPWIASSHYQVLDADRHCIAEVYGDEHIEADHRLIAGADTVLHQARQVIRAALARVCP